MHYRATLPKNKLVPVLLDMINKERSQVIGYTFEHEGVLYDADLLSLLNLISTLVVLSLGMELPVDFTWRSADNEDIPHTSETLISLGIAMWQARNGVYQKSFVKKNEVQEAEHPDQVSIKDWWK